MQNISPLYITGIGLVSGAGSSVEETRNFLRPNFRPTPIASDLCVIKVVPENSWYERLSLSSDTLLVNLMAVKATQEAFDSAGYTLQELRTLRVGVCLGSTVGCSNYQERFTREYCLNQKPGPEAVYEVFKSNSAQFISRHFKLRGPMQMISNACTSGADAIGIGASWLQADLCDVVVCGGTEVALASTFFGFKSLLLTSSKLCQPFDKNRQGLTLGDGAGIVILEKSTARKKAKAKLLGFGVGSDAYHPTAPHPEARGLHAAVQMALQQAGQPQIDFINTHGTATPHNDLAEGTWIRKNLPQATVVATKGYTGHTLGAAGAIEAVFTVMSLQEQKLPISRGFQEVDPQIGFAPTTEMTEGEFNTALSLSLGFGGTNTVLCLGRV